MPGEPSVTTALQSQAILWSAYPQPKSKAIGEPHVLRICDGRVLQGGEAGAVAEFPLLGEPGVKITPGPGRKMHQ
jgi:hypothetical protein